VDHQCDGRTDAQTDRIAIAIAASNDAREKRKAIDVRYCEQFLIREYCYGIVPMHIALQNSINFGQTSVNFCNMVGSSSLSDIIVT